jgi:hypothetical protein
LIRISIEKDVLWFSGDDVTTYRLEEYESATSTYNSASIYDVKTQN